VMSLVGLVTCLLLVVGVRTKQAKLLLPWQVMHAAVILACYVGGTYQALHYTLLVETANIVSACLSVCPLVVGIFFTFLLVFTIQLATTIRQDQDNRDTWEEKREALACLHSSLSGHQEEEGDRNPCRSVKSIRTLKRKKGSEQIKRWRSMDYLQTGQEYWIDYRASSLPRHMERSGSIYLASQYTLPSTDIVRRRNTARQSDLQTIQSDMQTRQTDIKTRQSDIQTRQSDIHTRQTDIQTRQSDIQTRQSDIQASCQSLQSVKSVSIHPEVTQYTYRHSIPRPTIRHTAKRLEDDRDVEIKTKPSTESAKSYSTPGSHTPPSHHKGNDRGSVPPPIYPSVSQPKDTYWPVTAQMTRHQIIDLFSTHSIKGR